MMMMMMMMISFGLVCFYNSQFTSNENISDSVGANCNRVIMLLTDGGTELPEAILNKYNANKTVRNSKNKYQ